MHYPIFEGRGIMNNNTDSKELSDLEFIEVEESDERIEKFQDVCFGWCGVGCSGSSNI